jgi:hypothetical protein
MDEVASRVAKRTGRMEMDIMAEWKEQGRLAGENGTLTHTYAESIVSGNIDKMTPPETDKQRRAFDLIDRALVMLSKQYEFLGTEQIIFDPLFLVAGMIDLPARNKTTGALAILDWKTNKDITSDSYGQVCLPPIQHLPASKVTKYELQLSLYGWVLTDADYSAYPSCGEPVECACIHIPHVGTEPVWRPMKYRGKEITQMITKESK